MMGCRTGHDACLRLLLEHGGRAPRGHDAAAAAAAGAGGPPPVPGPHLLVARPRLVRGRGGPRSSSPRGPTARLLHGTLRGRAPGRGRRARAHAADEQRRAVARLLARARARGRGRAGRAGRAAPGRRARAPGRRARPARARRARRRLHKGRDDAALAGARARSPVLHRPARALATRCIAGVVGCFRPVSTSYRLEADRPVALHLSVSPSLVPRRTQRDRSLADKNQRPPLLRPAAARLLPAASCRRCFLHDARPPTGWGRRGVAPSARPCRSGAGPCRGRGFTGPPAVGHAREEVARAGHGGRTAPGGPIARPHVAGGWTPAGRGGGKEVVGVDPVPRAPRDGHGVHRPSCGARPERLRAVGGLGVDRGRRLLPAGARATAPRTGFWSKEVFGRLFEGGTEPADELAGQRGGKGQVEGPPPGGRPRGRLPGPGRPRTAKSTRTPYDSGR